MKKLFFLMAILIVFALNTTFAQFVFISPPGTYSSSAPPGTNILYTVVNTCASNAGTCTYTWTATNGSIIGATTGVGLQTILVKWNNVNGTGNLVVSISSCSPSSTCTSASYSIPIRYLGPVGPMNIDGTPTVGPYAVGCDVTSFTASIDPVVNATSYAWTVPPGWSFTGSGTSISVTPGTSSGNISVVAKRSDAPDFIQSRVVSVSRSSGTAGISGILGNSYICSGSTTYSLDGTAEGTVNWSTNNPSLLTINSSSGLATKVGSSSGLVTVTANINNACGSFNINKQVWVGGPTIQGITPGSNRFICTATIESMEVISPPIGWMTYNWTITGGANGYFTSSTTNYYVDFINYTAEYNIIEVTASNICGTTHTGVSLITENCFAKYSVYPNPASDYINIELDISEKQLTLPESIQILSTSGRIIKEIRNEEIVNKEILNGKKIFELNVSDLPRGTYYLHVINDLLTHNIVKSQIILK